MSGHTPGPWMVCSPNLAAELNCGTLYIRTAEEAQEVAVVHHRLYESATPNAELIAAAPELLTALKAVLALNDDSPPAEYCRVRNAARAVVAKAEGR